jgi:hypothetical protein
MERKDLNDIVSGDTFALVKKAKRLSERLKEQEPISGLQTLVSTMGRVKRPRTD